MNKKNKNRGFTLVELLAVITIIGILLSVSVFAVTNFIERAKVEQQEKQEKIVALAAESYLQDNRQYLPKTVRETARVSIDVLKSKKYLTEDIKNANGVSCMENSYVVVSKETANRYKYTAHLNCGSN